MIYPFLQLQSVQQVSENNFTDRDVSSQTFSLPILSVWIIGDDSKVGGFGSSWKSMSQAFSKFSRIPIIYSSSDGGVEECELVHVQPSQHSLSSGLVIKSL